MCIWFHIYIYGIAICTCCSTFFLNMRYVSRLRLLCSRTPKPCVSCWRTQRRARSGTRCPRRRGWVTQMGIPVSGSRFFKPRAAKKKGPGPDFCLNVLFQRFFSGDCLNVFGQIWRLVDEFWGWRWVQHIDLHCTCMGMKIHTTKPSFCLHTRAWFVIFVISAEKYRNPGGLSVHDPADSDGKGWNKAIGSTWIHHPQFYQWVNINPDPYERVVYECLWHCFTKCFTNTSTTSLRMSI